MLDAQGEIIGMVANMMQRLATDSDPVRTKILEKAAACKVMRATFQRMRAVTIVAGPARLAGARMRVRVNRAKQDICDVIALLEQQVEVRGGLNYGSW